MISMHDTNTGKRLCIPRSDTKPTIESIPMNKITSLVIAPFLAASFILPAVADDYDPQALIKYRQDAMEAIKSHNNSMICLNHVVATHLQLFLFSNQFFVLGVSKIF